MKWLKKLFMKRGESAKTPPMSSTIVDSQPVIAAAEQSDRTNVVPVENDLIACVIADLIELDLQIKPLTQNSWPGSPQWDQLMLLSNKQVSRARTLTPTDLPRIEPYLKNQDAETRRTAAYLIKVIYLDSPTVPLSTNMISLLGSLLHDISDDVRNTALDTLCHVSKLADIGAAATDLVASLAVSDKNRRMNVIEALAGVRQKSDIVVKALQDLQSEQAELNHQLHYLAISHGDIDLAKQLISKGADVRSTPDLLVTVINITFPCDKKGLLEFLIANGADVNEKNTWGFYPLHYAAKNGNKDIVRILIANGADVNVKDNEGRTPEQCARTKDIAAIIRAGGAMTYFDSCEAGLVNEMEKLLAADVNAKDNYTELLFIAAYHNHKEVAKLLISKGADVKATSDTGWTALHSASHNNSKDVAEILIANGADVNAKDNRGNTPLHIAAMTDYKEVAELLINKGADISAKNNKALVPLDEAARNSKSVMTEFLTAKSAELGDTPHFVSAIRSLSPSDGSCILYFYNAEARDSAYRIMTTPEFLWRIYHIERRDVTNREVMYKHWIVCDTKAYDVRTQDYLKEAGCECPESQYVDYWRVAQDSEPL